ncbi:unnamed protein product [Lathyrus oleraceus]|uniref:F-box/kelch-repeat protein At3g23880-like n=1 Tax=Pisum sativum TaxID=3888 RepID=UPI001FC51742|nr:F-box/kelch-repeat protein At3g23880-like [Pisum sativum]
MNPSPIFLPDDLIAKLLSFLPVKSLVRFKCVSKSWRTLISDSTFVKLHLKNSATQNPMFTLITHHMKTISGDSPYGSYKEDYSVVPYPIATLLDNPALPLFDDPYYYVKNKGCSKVIASCNGLILLTGDLFNGIYSECWFQLWNPATKTISKEIGYFDFDKPFRYAFGCDDSTNTYKVVASRYIPKQRTTEVRILSLDDDVWRDIESFPVVPLHLDYAEYNIYDSVYGGVYLSGTVNWLAIHNNIHYNTYVIKNITVEDFVIVSLDLRTETYNQYRLPRDFDEVPPSDPTIGVLGGFLCFSYSYKNTDFVIWRMKKFGVEDSWTQFLKINYQNLQTGYDINDFTKYYFHLMPLLLSKDGDTLVLKIKNEDQAILYNLRDNRVKRTKIRGGGWVCWESLKGYTESLVPVY